MKSDFSEQVSQHNDYYDIEEKVKEIARQIFKLPIDFSFFPVQNIQNADPVTLFTQNKDIVTLYFVHPYRGSQVFVSNDSPPYEMLINYSDTKKQEILSFLKVSSSQLTMDNLFQNVQLSFHSENTLQYLKTLLKEIGLESLKESQESKLSDQTSELSKCSDSEKTLISQSTKSLIMELKRLIRDLEDEEKLSKVYIFCLFIYNFFIIIFNIIYN